jgi:hypothetical protein
VQSPIVFKDVGENCPNLLDIRCTIEYNYPWSVKNRDQPGNTGDVKGFRLKGRPKPKEHQEEASEQQPLATKDLRLTNAFVVSPAGKPPVSFCPQGRP